MKSKLVMPLATVILIFLCNCFLFSQQSAGNISRAQNNLNIQSDKTDGGDKTLSPYFFVQSDSDETDCLPLLETTVEVNVSGVIADVAVRQIYKNSGKSPLEAVYVFPASTRAAVYAMTMTIGERELKAVIQPKLKAREIYEQAKSEGRSASLLEQRRPNVFQMNVANIMPGDVIIVEMQYAELLVPEDKIYEFAYPTVVGPRYSNKPAGTASDEDQFVETPYMRSGSEMPFKFDIKMRLAAGMEIGEIECPSHSSLIRREGLDIGEISLDDEGRKNWNKDFIVRYTLSGDNIETGMLLSKGDENFFLLMLQPPRRVEEKMVTMREYIYVVDVSGSMHGFPIEVAKVLMRNLLESLNPEDRFNLILFSYGQGLLAEESVKASQNNIDRALGMLVRQSGSGGTELLPALEKAISLPKTEGYSRSVIVITDGFVDCESEAFELIRNNLNNANLFAFGIGSSVNRYLIEALAKAGEGEPFIVTHPDEAEYMAFKLNEYIKSPVMTGIEVDFGRFKAYDIEPPTIPDVLADRPILIYGKWDGYPEGTVRVSGYAGEQKLHVDIPVEKYGKFMFNPALKYLWARNKIALLSDFPAPRTNKKDVDEEITNLGMKYNLLTRNTSFIAEDYIVRNEGGKLVRMKQASPMPEGVSDRAISDNAQYMSVRARAASSGGAAFSYLPSISNYPSAEDNPLLPREKISPFFIGLTFGYNRAVHTISDERVFPTSLGDLPPADFSKSEKNSYYAGLTLEYLLGNPVNSHSSLFARLLYSSMPAYFSAPGPLFQAVTILDGEEKIIYATTQHTLDVKYSVASLELQYKQNLFNTLFGVTFGPTFDFALTRSEKQNFSLLPNKAAFSKGRIDELESNSYKFEDNYKSLVVNDGDIKESSALRLGLKLGVQYEILFGRMYLVPSFSYNYGLTNLMSEINWRANAIQIGFDLRFSL